MPPTKGIRISFAMTGGPRDVIMGIGAIEMFTGRPSTYKIDSAIVSIPDYCPRVSAKKPDGSWACWRRCVTSDLKIDTARDNGYRVYVESQELFVSAKQRCVCSNFGSRKHVVDTFALRPCQREQSACAADR
jgi:hypothetical protein